MTCEAGVRSGANFLQTMVVDRINCCRNQNEREEAGMTPNREEFLLDVRRAARLAEKPTVITSSELANPDVIAKTLHRAALWLTPKIVENYDPNMFNDWPVALRDGLTRAVETFRAIAGTVPANQPATAEQFAQGEEAFRGLLSALRDVVLAEWRPAVDGLVGNTESWAKEFGWATKRVPKRLSETLLGTYEIPQLLMHAAPNLYVLDPVARFVPGAAGAFDLSVQPSFYTISLYRDFDGIWHAHHAVGQGANTGKRDKWDKEPLRQCVEELGALQ
jgi:hypothetical protein